MASTNFRSIDDTLLVELQAQQRKNALDDIACSALIIELPAENPDWSLEDALSAVLPGVQTTTELFFAGVDDDKLSRFITVKLLGIHLENLSDGPYELAHQVRSILDIPSCDPIFHCQPEDAPKYDGGSRDGGDGAPEDKEWHLKTMKVEEAWYVSADQRKPPQGLGIKIAQIDTGIVYHELTPRQVFTGGRNLMEPGSEPVDPMNYAGRPIGFPGHGQAPSGMAVNQGRIEGGSPTLRGVAPMAKVMPYRATNTVLLYENNAPTIAKAIVHAVEDGADVISISLGGIFIARFLTSAIEFAWSKQVIMTAAAGNRILGIDVVVYPARHPNVIAVAATDINNKPYTDGILASPAGPEIFLSLPGHQVWGPNCVSHDDPQCKKAVSAGSGTTYSAGLMGAIAALWLAHHRDDFRLRRGHKPYLFELCLRSTGVFRPDGWDSGKYGRGIVDAEKLLKFDLGNIATSDVVEPEYKITKKELSQLGVNQDIVDKLTEEDAAMFGCELLWYSVGESGRPLSRALKAKLQRDDA